MPEIPYTELSIGVSAVATLYWVVKAFLKHLTNKDKVFTTTINNHIAHSIESQTKLTGAINSLKDKL